MMACDCRRRFRAEASEKGKARARQDRARECHGRKQDSHSAGGEARERSCHLYARVVGIGLELWANIDIDMYLRSGAAVAISAAMQVIAREETRDETSRANEQTGRRGQTGADGADEFTRPWKATGHARTLALLCLALPSLGCCCCALPRAG